MHIGIALLTQHISLIPCKDLNYTSKINQANKEDFEKWIQFHLQTCEDKNLLGYSLHGLIILEKEKKKGNY